MNWELKKYPMYCAGVKQTYRNVRQGSSFMSRSAVVGNIIFLSGATGANLKTGEIAAGFENQVTATLDNIRLALEEAGSSLNNMIKSYIFLKNAADCPVMWRTMLEYFRKHAPELVEEPPAVCVTQVESLPVAECLIEIDAIGVVSKNMPGWEVKKFPLYHEGAKTVPGKPFMSESVAIGNLLLLSAMDATNPGNSRVETGVFEEQWQAALDKVKAAMDRAGSSMSNVIKTLHFQTGLEGLLQAGKDEFRSHSPASDRLWKTELEYFDMHAPFLMDDPPGSTFMKVSSLANPGCLGQTDVIGVISRFKPGWEVRKYPTYIGRRGFPRHMGDIKKYYANTVKVGNLVIVSGQTPTDNYTARIESDIFEEQALVTLNNLKESLEETGSALENVVKTHILLPNPENLTAMRRIEAEFYQKYAPNLLEEPPATTVTHLLSLASPKMHIEIEAIAVTP